MAYHKTSISRLKSLNKESDIVDRKKPNSRRTKTYCICDGPSDGFMIECETCKGWFHASCVGLDEKEIPTHFYCQSCVIDSKEMEDTIVEALSLLAEQAIATQSLNHLQDLQDMSSDRDESMQEELQPLTSDDKENIPNGIVKVEAHSILKKRKVLQIGNGDAKSLMDIPSSPMSDNTHSGSEDSSPSTDPPSSPSSPTSPGAAHTRRNQPHSVTKTYTRKNKKQIAVLEKFYEESQSPDADMIHHIANESNLPEQKVARWFYDKRRRSKQLNQGH